MPLHLATLYLPITLILEFHFLTSLEKIVQNYNTCCKCFVEIRKFIMNSFLCQVVYNLLAQLFIYVYAIFCIFSTFSPRFLIQFAISCEPAKRHTLFLLTILLCKTQCGEIIFEGAFLFSYTPRFSSNLTIAVEILDR